MTCVQILSYPNMFIECENNLGQADVTGLKYSFPKKSDKIWTKSMACNPKCLTELIFIFTLKVSEKVLLLNPTLLDKTNSLHVKYLNKNGQK